MSEVELSCCCTFCQFVSETQTISSVMLMDTMKKLLLFLSGLLWVSAEVVHVDLAISGCSDSDGEVMYSLDGEEIWYADFVKGTGVEPQPPFIDHMSLVEGTYEQAVASQQICKQNLKVLREAEKDIPLKNDPPSSLIVYSRDDVEIGQKNVLICYVTGFYPAPVKVYWTKNGKNVTEGTSINVPYPNDDFSFNQISRLDFIPQQGDVYSCSVTHPALQEHKTRIWGENLSASPNPGIGPAVFCGLGLTVGLLGVAAGTFFLIKGNECS
ncbi:H-2 class II histocompatibility antigen, A-U alpha chain-like [Echeneis naucrates]|uniref:H-2 class II histocompatibility antigen, A-U alpha chain-like n=1 Tax=Echeneis naucrates TaxID=173247 RepID=UPI001113C0E4|nr:H-2 class II histocompatibility antigen, A-U alpha chain-like [Echeneis naucrates]